ncbi:MAG: hypothetical protein AAGE59_22585 [Cyanobacteria bacterium P01_F01_bin.86]
MTMLFLFGTVSVFVFGFACGALITAITAANRGIKGMEKDAESVSAPSLFSVYST